MHNNPKNEKPDTMSKGVTKGNKIWNVNTETPQYSSISKNFLISLSITIKTTQTAAQELMVETSNINIIHLLKTPVLTTKLI